MKRVPKPGDVSSRTTVARRRTRVSDSEISPCGDEMLEGVEEFGEGEPNPANRLVQDGVTKLDLLLLGAREAMSSKRS